MSGCNRFVLIDTASYEKYKKLKQLRLTASKKLFFSKVLTLRLLVLLDSLDNDLYDYEELLADIRMTIADLYNDMAESYKLFNYDLTKDP